MEERMSVLAVHIVRIHDINNSEHKQHTKQSEELCVQQIQICYIRLLYLSISLCAMHLTCVLYKYDCTVVCYRIGHTPRTDFGMYRMLCLICFIHSSLYCHVIRFLFLLIDLNTI